MKKYAGVYRGRVEDADDPLRIGRLRVRVPQIHPISNPEKLWSGVATEHLPWAEGMFPSSGNGYGSFAVPYRKGDWVFVMFEGGDATAPLWIGGPFFQHDEEVLDEEGNPILNDQGEPLTELKSNAPDGTTGDDEYPYVAAHVTPRGHRLEFSDVEGNAFVRLSDLKGNYIEINTEDDAMKIKVTGDVVEHVTGSKSSRVDNERSYKSGYALTYHYANTDGQVAEVGNIIDRVPYNEPTFPERIDALPEDDENIPVPTFQKGLIATEGGTQ